MVPAWRGQNVCRVTIGSSPHGHFCLTTSFMSDLLISFAGPAVLLVTAGVSGAAVWCALSVISMAVSG